MNKTCKAVITGLLACLAIGSCIVILASYIIYFAG